LPLQSYLGLGVDLLHLSPYVNVGVEKDYTRIKLYGDIRVGLLKTEYSGIDLGIKYKFRFNGVNKN